MSKPIPDKTLLDFVEAEHELVSLPGYGTVSCSDLGTFGEDMARELLALREAARSVDRAQRAIMLRFIFGIKSHLEAEKPGKPAIEAGDLIANEYAALEALLALLPEEPK